MNRLSDVVSKEVVKKTLYNKLNMKVNNIENKIPDTSALVTTAVLNTKIGKVENKLPDTSGLVNKTDYNAKYQIFRRNILLLLIIINLHVTYLMQR